MAKARRKPIPKSPTEGPIVDLLAVPVRKPRPKPTPEQSAELAREVHKFFLGLRLFAEERQQQEQQRQRRLQQLLKGVGKSPQKQRREVRGYQGSRVKIKLAERFPDGVPSAKVLSDSDLVNMVRKAFEDDPRAKKTGLAIPDRKTILREASRIPRKK